ncbi:unnamed protein product [Aphanomyces euteiches]|nr:hypothetical protein Ae201684P_003498 [Aphanomyces euteiches]KAH9155853.1 hypothetical protein AeRB84_002207 [Aphanomyces euteiches]
MKLFRHMIRRGPFDPRHYLHAAQFKFMNACDSSCGSLPPWGPPHEAYHDDVDTQLFAIYFLFSETLATCLWFSIAAHCLRGTRIPFLTPQMRYIVGLFYAVVKIALIHYGFQASIYLHMSMVWTVVCCFFLSLAWGWHRGPLWFLFYMKPPRLFQPFTLPSFLQHVGYLILQGVSSTSHHPPSIVMTTHSTNPTDMQLQLFHKLHVPLSLDIWNATLVEHWRQSVLDFGDEPSHRVLCADGFATEARLLFAMQSNGLLVAIYLMTPDATTVHALMEAGDDVNIFELVLRYHNHSSAFRSTSMQFQKTPVVYFADNPISSRHMTPAQRHAITCMLQRLNINMSIGYVRPCQVDGAHRDVGRMSRCGY